MYIYRQLVGTTIVVGPLSGHYHWTTAIAESSPKPTLAQMPLDLKVMSTDGTSLYGATWPNPAEVSGSYNLIQRIYLNLLTEAGEVEDAPSWGSSLRSSILPIPGQSIDAAMAAATAVVSKCQADIQSNTSPDPAERLVSLRLASITFSDTLAAWQIAITIVSEVASNTISLVAN